MRTEAEHNAGLRSKNRAAVLLCLHREGEISRKQLAAKLTLTPAAMTKIVSELLMDGLLVEIGAVSSKSVGRREILLSLRAESRCALGIWLGLGRAILSAVRLDGSVIGSETVPLPVRAPAQATVEKLATRLLSLIEAHRIPPERIIGVGVAVRGVIGRDGRTVHDSFDALDTPDFPICAQLEACTGYPAVLSNNVRALSLAQMFLSRKPQAGSTFFVRCGAGIGAALSQNGSIVNGSRGQCAEIGHIPVLRRGGKPCHCGKSGCLETVASPTAIREDAQAILSPTDTPLLWQLTKGDRDAVTTELVLDAARGGDYYYVYATGVKNGSTQEAGRCLIANAVYDGSSAIMLSGESASGKYPVEAVKAMAGIAEEAERHIDYITRFEQQTFVLKNNIDALSHSCCQLAIDTKATCIVATTRTGLMGRMVARFRPPMPIIGMATNEKAYRQLAMSWNVIPAIADEFNSTDVLFYHAGIVARQTGLAKKGDTIVITGGVTNGASGNYGSGLGSRT